MKFVLANSILFLSFFNAFIHNLLPAVTGRREAHSEKRTIQHSSNRSSEEVNQVPDAVADGAVNEDGSCTRLLLAQTHLSYVSVQMMALAKMILGKKSKVAYTHYNGRYYHLI
jgi:hypothetical protein